MSLPVTLILMAGDQIWYVTDLCLGELPLLFIEKIARHHKDDWDENNQIEYTSLDKYAMTNKLAHLNQKKNPGSFKSKTLDVGFTLPDMSNLADDITKVGLEDCTLIGNVELDVHRSNLIFVVKVKFQNW